LAKMSRDKFSLVISLVKVDKSLCQVTQGGGGGGRRNVTKCHIGGGGPKSAEKVSRIFWMAPKIFWMRITNNIHHLTSRNDLSNVPHPWTWNHGKQFPFEKKVAKLKLKNMFLVDGITTFEVPFNCRNLLIKLVLRKIWFG
jgi:hypothetical protein